MGHRSRKLARELWGDGSVQFCAPEPLQVHFECIRVPEFPSWLPHMDLRRVVAENSLKTIDSTADPILFRAVNWMVPGNRPAQVSL